jgi:hypothetical protein
MKTPQYILRFGLISAVILVILTLITWGLAMIAVPPSGPYCPGDCMSYPYADLLEYYPRDYYWMYAGIFQLIAYLLFMISGYFIASPEKKLFGFSSVVFALIAGIVLLLAYFVQFTIVPISMIEGKTDGIALITQYNDHGLFIAMEDLGYIMMSISFFFLAFTFAKRGIHLAIRLTLISGVVFTALSFLYYTIEFGIDRSYRFEVAAITINWLVTLIAGIMVSIAWYRALNSPIS